jgi:ADP-ribosyl-[dinitrogen reductase] hydrolase
MADLAMDERDRFRGCLLGLACGDAVGTTVEFCPRGSFNPVTDMVGQGPFNLEPGQWTDDTSLALCLATSLTELEKFDPRDQMLRYCKWRDEGYLSSKGYCFGYGYTVIRALHRFSKTGEPFSGPVEPRFSSNGCIMRLAPVPMFFHPNREAVIRFSGESSRTTHGAPECVDACRLFGAILFGALSGAAKEEVLFGHSLTDLLTQNLQSIARGDYRHKSESEIQGSGYVVRCLEAALWCFLQTGTFREAILRAVNLGDDADTTAAVCGQVAGAYYGASQIPVEWFERLARRDEIQKLADRLWQSGGGA